MGDIIKFPTHLRRVANKYKQEEIAHIAQMLKLCDDDMQCIVEQIEQLNLELKALTNEYETLLEKLKKLTDEDSND